MSTSSSRYGLSPTSVIPSRDHPVPAYHNTVSVRGHHISAKRGQGCGPKLRKGNTILSRFTGSEAHRHRRGQGVGQRIRVNKFSRRGRCFPSSKTRRGGAESDREWRGVQAAPWFVIGAVKIGNSWNVVKEDVTVM